MDGQESFCKPVPRLPARHIRTSAGPFRSYASSPLHRPRLAPPTNGRRGHRAYACSDDLTTPLRVSATTRAPTMCIAAWTWQSHPAYGLLLLFNRDEYHSRSICSDDAISKLILHPSGASLGGGALGFKMGFTLNLQFGGPPCGLVVHLAAGEYGGRALLLERLQPTEGAMEGRNSSSEASAPPKSLAPKCMPISNHVGGQPRRFFSVLSAGIASSKAVTAKLGVVGGGAAIEAHRSLQCARRHFEAFGQTPTRPAEWWTAAGEEGKEILGGRDELGGGTWLGCTKGGKLAFLTNVREPNPRVGAKSRGELPVRFLQGRLGPSEYATEIAKEADQYNGFNLILVDVRSGAMVYISNKPSGALVVQTVPPGFHVLSNAAIDSPWPKALRLGQSFSRFLSTHDDAEVSLKQMVEELMTDTVKADRCMVPDTGVDSDWEHQLSSIFIDTERGQARYGTRSMAAVAVKLDGEVSFYERSLNSCSWKENLVQFDMEVPR